MLHNGTLRNLHLPSSPSWASLPLSLFLSSTFYLLLFPACPISHFPPLSISLLQRGHHAVILAISNGSWTHWMGDCKCSTDEILGGEWDCVNQWLMKADQAPSSPITHTSETWPATPFISHFIGKALVSFIGKSLSVLYTLSFTYNYCLIFIFFQLFCCSWFFFCINEI